MLRVTDERGATATVRRVINVLREPLPPRAGAGQPARPRRAAHAPTAVAFSARLAGTHTRRGGQR